MSEASTAGCYIPIPAVQGGFGGFHDVAGEVRQDAGLSPHPDASGSGPWVRSRWKLPTN